MANNLQRSLFIFVGLLFISMPAMALDSYKQFKRDHWDFELASQFFYSEANYGAFGTGTHSLPDGNHYQLLDITFESRYVPQPTWSMFVLGNIGNAESDDIVAKRTNSSFNQAAAGIDFLIYTGSFELVPEFLLVMPFERVDSSSDTVLNSEGVIELHSRLIAQKDFGSWRGYGWLGFNYRGEGRSYLVPYGVGALLKFSRVQWGAEILGFQSVSSDSTSGNAALRTGYINGVNAGSKKFYSVEPSLVDTQLYMNWLVSRKWMVQINGGATLAGENSAAGFHVGGFFRYSFDMTEGFTQPEDEMPSSRSNIYNDSDLSSEKKVKSFREDTNDGVDQQIFKPQPVAPIAPVTPEVRQVEQLDNTDFQIELKSKKRKKKRKQ